MIITILNGLLPVAFVIGLGWFAGRMGLLKHENAATIAVYVIRFALPFALFEAAATTAPEKILDPGMALCLTFGLMGTYFIGLFVGRYVFKHDLKSSTMQALVCAYPDMAYFGAPILSSMFGPAGYLLVLVGNLVTSIIMLPLTIVLAHVSDKKEGGHDWRDGFHVVGGSLLSAATNPIVWLPIFGVILSFCHVKLPGPIVASVDIIGKSAGATSLFALGLLLYGEKFQINRDVLANLGIKNFVMPALMLAGAFMFGLNATGTHGAIITGAVPTATAAAMFALRNNSYTSEATATILVSTILGIFTEAVLIAVFSS